MKKKWIAMGMVAALCATSLFGCSSKSKDTKENDTSKETSTENTTTKTENSAGSTTSDNSTADTTEPVTLKWIAVGGGMPSNYDAWAKHINEYLGEKIGVNIDVEVVSWGDWDNKRNLVVSSGEPFDILFTDSSRYVSEVKLGAYCDITELLKTSASELYSYIPEDYWDAVKVDGKIYSVPTYKDSSATQYMVWDKAIVDKYGIDIQNSTTLDSLTAKLEEVKNGEGTAPVVLDSNGLNVILSSYDQMGAELPCLGVRYDDESRTVVNVLQQEEVKKDLATIYDWYSKGIINADAPTLSETPSYRMFFTAQGWSGAAKTTWGPNMGVEAEAVKFMDSIVSNTTVRGSLNAISSGSKYPEKCLEFLQLMNTDSYVRDAFYYGLEGENFNYTADKKVEKLNSDWTMAGYTQGTFFNVSQLSDADFNQWDEVKELNANATGSVLLGFNLDTTNIENELVNCREAYNKYKSLLFTGAQDPEKVVADLNAELENAGFDKIMKEAQAQIDAMYK